jgi:sulfate transport system ATP-binding protein
MSIQLHHISKSFGGFKALDDVTLDVPDGELVALLGPSGSGKTTLLRVIAGLEAADPGSGPILFHRQDVARQRVGDRRVGFVFQHYALFRHMTVFENVAFGLRVRPRKSRPTQDQIRARVLELLRLVQLENLAPRYPAQLSGGQRQRIALARALAVEPRVMLLDEPFGALDAKVRQGLRRWLRQLHDQVHVTSVFVTHDQEEALEVADRIVVMHHGRVEQIGTPNEVFHQPANAFVMDFLGNVNLFHGRIEDGRAILAPPPPAGEIATAGSAGNGTIAGLRGRAGTAAAPGGSRVFVRPHELDIVRQGDGDSALPATVQRVHAAGPLVKIELTGPRGELVQVEMAHQRFAAGPVAAGDKVFVRARQGHTFEDDFSI